MGTGFVACVPCKSSKTLTVLHLSFSSKLFPRHLFCLFVLIHFFVFKFKDSSVHNAHTDVKGAFCIQSPQKCVHVTRRYSFSFTPFPNELTVFSTLLPVPTLKQRRACWFQSCHPWPYCYCLAFKEKATPTQVCFLLSFFVVVAAVAFVVFGGRWGDSVPAAVVNVWTSCLLGRVRNKATTALCL